MELIRNAARLNPKKVAWQVRCAYQIAAGCAYQIAAECAYQIVVVYQIVVGCAYQIAVVCAYAYTRGHAHGCVRGTECACAHAHSWCVHTHIPGTQCTGIAALCVHGCAWACTGVHAAQRSTVCTPVLRGHGRGRVVCTPWSALAHRKVRRRGGGRQHLQAWDVTTERET
eukprot:366271-Rhodomonas_salina.2